MGSQTNPEDMLISVLVEIEGIWNAKLIGYESSDITDCDPYPNSLLVD